MEEGLNSNYKPLPHNFLNLDSLNDSPLGSTAAEKCSISRYTPLFLTEKLKDCSFESLEESRCKETKVQFNRNVAVHQFSPDQISTTDEDTMNNTSSSVDSNVQSDVYDITSGQCRPILLKDNIKSLASKFNELESKYNYDMAYPELPVLLYDDENIWVDSDDNVDRDVDVADSNDINDDVSDLSMTDFKSYCQVINQSTGSELHDDDNLVDNDDDDDDDDKNIIGFKMTYDKMKRLTNFEMNDLSANKNDSTDIGEHGIEKDEKTGLNLNANNSTEYDHLKYDKGMCKNDDNDSDDDDDDYQDNEDGEDDEEKNERNDKKKYNDSRRNEISITSDLKKNKSPVNFHNSIYHNTNNNNKNKKKPNRKNNNKIIDTHNNNVTCIKDQTLDKPGTNSTKHLQRKLETLKDGEHLKQHSVNGAAFIDDKTRMKIKEKALSMLNIKENINYTNLTDVNFNEKDFLDQEVEERLGRVKREKHTFLKDQISRVPNITDFYSKEMFVTEIYSKHMPSLFPYSSSSMASSLGPSISHNVINTYKLEHETVDSNNAFDLYYDSKLWESSI